ncbi:hypothetical protein [Brevibacterium picturae]|uniref:Uncharacterized protein n=1 Tax=Brevibacterium picturae TaxID=260553 RepID=A0ABN2B369_9MICO
MPTYTDPTREAAETAEATRGLAHAIGGLSRPEAMPGILGNLLDTTRRLQDVLTGLSRQHVDLIDRASTDAGDAKTGEAHAFATADALDEAATLLSQAEARLDRASTHAHLIAWQPAPTPERQWLNVVFLQGQEADEVLALIDAEGEDAALDHLQGFDAGAETTDAALTHGYVYTTPPTTALDRTAAGGEYTMVYNRDLGHVGLYRTFTPDPDDALDADGADHAPGASRPVIKPAPRRTPGKNTPTPTRQGASPRRDASWFDHPGVTPVQQGRGLGR